MPDVTKIIPHLKAKDHINYFHQLYAFFSELADRKDLESEKDPKLSAVLQTILDTSLNTMQSCFASDAPISDQSIHNFVQKQ